jgi:hypothetical protein
MKTLRCRKTAATVLFCFGMLSASLAQGTLYWTNFTNNTIGRAGADGTSVNNTLITGLNHPGDVFVYADTLYFSSGGAIGTAALDGTAVNPALITGVFAGTRLAGDSSFLFWSQSTNNSNLGRANYDGTGRTTISGSLGILRGIASRTDTIYGGEYAYSGSTGSVSGAAAQDLGFGMSGGFSTAAGSVNGLLLDANYTYYAWNTGGIGGIGRWEFSNPVGAGTDNFITFNTAAQDVVSDGTYLYFTLGTGYIGRSLLDGSSLDLTFINTGAGVFGLAYTAVPEPATTAALVGVASLSLALWRRRKMSPVA